MNGKTGPVGPVFFVSYQSTFVMAGLSRLKNNVAYARPGHPRLAFYLVSSEKTWMPGTSPGMT